MKNAFDTTPWIEKLQSDERTLMNLPNLIILHNFDLVTEETTHITIKVFGLEGDQKLVISPKAERPILNRTVVPVRHNEITDPAALDIFKSIPYDRIDFVEDAGQYWQIDVF